LITIKNLFKKYENLTIEENEVFGLLGPNGAGKTTTIHMLATLLKPTSAQTYFTGLVCPPMPPMSALIADIVVRILYQEKLSILAIYYMFEFCA
jgi:ABC-type multidrug transport system ATPase subunit